MATTGFWPVKGNLKNVIDYAENPDKTTDPKYLDDDLRRALTYVENDSKTDRKMYVSTINCPKQDPYGAMTATKRRFGKLGGNVAYHGYQSFKTGEVTAAEAHAIGIETARQMWGDEYEIVVTTHLNTDNIHNHMVVNSVSFKTGRKFENHVSDHYRLREISDAICAQRGKSVLENASFYGGEKGAYWAHKDGKLTHRDILKRDVEYCLSLSRTPEDFRRRLVSLGYVYSRDDSHREPSVMAPGWKRPVRLSSIGYTADVLNQRLDQNWEDVYFIHWRNANPMKKATPLLLIEQECRRAQYMDGIQLTFAIFIELLRLCTGEVTQQKARPLSPMLREEVRKLDQYIDDYKLLCTENIGTAEELSAFREDISGQIQDLEAQREQIRNRIRRAPGEDKPLLKEQAKAVTSELIPLRKQLRQADRIMERSKKISAHLTQERQMETKELQRIRERSYER